MSFGSTLKQAREAQGFSTQDLALRTKIRGDYLRALEEGNTSLLPERTFARSYLQRYARELNLDPAPLMAEFDRTMPVSAEIAQSLRGAGGRERPATPMNPAVLAGGLTALIVVGAAGYYAYSTFLRPAPVSTVVAPAATPSRAVPTPPPPPPPAAPRTVRLTISSVPAGARVYLDNRDLGVTPVKSFPVAARDQAELRVELGGRQGLRQSVSLVQGRNLRAQLPVAGQGKAVLADLNTPAGTPKPATPAPAGAVPAGAVPAATGPAGTPPTATTPATPQAAVRVTFSGESWTRVTGPSGQVLYQGTPPVGSVKGFPAGVTVRTGNAGAVRVSVNGAPAQAMGQSGQVLTKSY
ncbi:RodZ domain-containing protein [Deinococcus koreensis]|uniref:DUF4115 domain-containing protein n=1 Tax=Deinococcus koreensis TaxID=2054903 RepID=A0A2K3UVH9_9DEIO|nr:RodZ domain-containing protein [Deinococcus koreensis]PNY80538.1 DUF4115 domain-containing protein [Deinococcus koreensis]